MGSTTRGQLLPRFAVLLLSVGCEMTGRVGAAHGTDSSTSGAVAEDVDASTTAEDMREDESSSEPMMPATSSAGATTSEDSGSDEQTGSSGPPDAASSDGSDSEPPEGTSSGAVGTQGACCDPGRGPGCGDPELEACVCEADGFCCDVQWDEACVDVARFGACAGACPVPDVPPPDDCCVDNDGGGGCLDPQVQDCVCLEDPYCCDYAWDGVCVDHIEMLGCGSCA